MAKARAARGAQDVYDVLVAGSGPGGAALAGFLAKAGRRVLVVALGGDKAAGGPIWGNVLTLPLLESLGVAGGGSAREMVSEAVVHSLDMKKSHRVVFPKPMGWFADAGTAAASILAAAKRHGAAQTRADRVTAVTAGEDAVGLACADGTSCAGRLLMLVDPLSEEMLAGIGLRMPTSPPGGCLTQASWPSGKDSELAGGAIHFILGIDNGKGLGVAWSRGGRTILRVIAADTERARSHCDDLIGRLRRGGADTAVEIGAAPTGRAMDFESHVGKRTLLLGEAGGFVAAATGEDFYPAVWAARIAAEVADRALASVQPQDALREFDTAWRVEMADYLRPPHADLQYLLPIVFANKAMAARLATALLGGGTL